MHLDRLQAQGKAARPAVPLDDHDGILGIVMVLVAEGKWEHRDIE